MPSLWYVAAAYGAIWLVLLLYLVTIHQRVTDLREQLDAARRSEPATGGLPARAGAMNVAEDEAPLKA